jgi:chaperonin GroEL (HSP60 family)
MLGRAKWARVEKENTTIVDGSGKKADIQAGINIVSKALESPIRQIVENAGVEGSIVVGQGLDKTGSFGFDARDTRNVSISSRRASSIRPRRFALQNEPRRKRRGSRLRYRAGMDLLHAAC